MFEVNESCSEMFSPFFCKHFYNSHDFLLNHSPMSMMICFSDIICFSVLQVFVSTHLSVFDLLKGQVIGAVLPFIPLVTF